MATTLLEQHTNFLNEWPGLNMTYDHWKNLILKQMINHRSLIDIAPDYKIRSFDYIPVKTQVIDVSKFKNVDKGAAEWFDFTI